MSELCINENVLFKIPTQDLPELAKIYENVIWAPFSSCIINTAFRWGKEKTNYPNAYTVYSPNNSWRKNGTYIVIINVDATKNISISTLDENCESLYQGLKALLPQNNCYLKFFATHERFIPTCYKVFKEFGLDFFETKCRMVVMPPKEAASLKVECPDNFYIQPLDYCLDTKKINAVWPQRFKDSKKFVRLLIKENGGFGIYHKETDELAAWAVRQVLGHIGLLQTDEKYQRLGLGQVIANVLSREIGKEGHWPYATIVVNNVASLNMFKKLNFQDIGYCSYFSIKIK